MLDLASYQAVTKLIQQLQRSIDRSSGALETVNTQLKKDFGCKNVKEAKAKLEELEEEKEELTTERDKQQKAFESKWGDKLEELL